MMLHTKHQRSRPWDFRQDFFSCFPNISLCKTCDPGAGHLWPKGLYFEQTWYRGPLGDATCTYQILGVLDQTIFSCVPYIS